MPGWWNTTALLRHLCVAEFRDRKHAYSPSRQAGLLTSGTGRDKRRAMKSEEIRKAIQSALSRISIIGKCGSNILQPAIAGAIRHAGFEADEEDDGFFLSPRMSVWRSKDTNDTEITGTRRQIEIVVHWKGRPVALIETESDLNDLKRNGVTLRNGHYDVLSIARNADGAYFDSYKSLERMAAAAFYHHLQEDQGFNMAPELAERAIEGIKSNEPRDHNPAGLALFLVTGFCRQMDRKILQPRLSSLNAQLISALVR
jgi:hypothetical protein